MASKEAIITYVQSNNKPVTRKEILKELSLGFSQQTLYKSITSLIEEKRLLELTNKTLIVNPNPESLTTYIEWNIPPILREYTHATAQLPLLNMIKNDPVKMQKHLRDNILPEHGEHLTVMLLNLMWLYQLSSDNIEIFEQYPDLPYNEEINEEANKHLNALIK